MPLQILVNMPYAKAQKILVDRMPICMVLGLCYMLSQILRVLIDKNFQSAIDGRKIKRDQRSMDVIRHVSKVPFSLEKQHALVRERIGGCHAVSFPLRVQVLQIMTC
jgi:hypothetical protein